MNQLLVVEYDNNLSNSANEIYLMKCLTHIKKRENKTLILSIFLFVACIIGFISLFYEGIYDELGIFIICTTVLIVLARRITLKKNIKSKYNIYNKYKKFNLTFYDEFLEFNVDNKYIKKISYSKFKELYGTKDIFLINSICCIYKNCIDPNVSNEIENILMDKLGDRYKQLDIK